MRTRRRSKSEAKVEIFDFQEKILVDTSTFDNNNRPKLKVQLQTMIQDQMPTSGNTALEIGIGNGAFINEIAVRNPDTLYIGVELKEERILDAHREAVERNIENTILLRISADFLDEVILEQQIDTIYMNFPDPWPKKRHIKNRMTTAKFLKKYETILKKNGKFILKTDNENMYEYSLEELGKSRITPIQTETNLKNDQNNIETQFEKRYRGRNKNIFQIIAKKQ